MLSGFELYARWVPLLLRNSDYLERLSEYLSVVMTSLYWPVDFTDRPCDMEKTRTCLKPGLRLWTYIAFKLTVKRKCNPNQQSRDVCFGNSPQFGRAQLTKWKLVSAHLIILKRSSGVQTFVGTRPSQYRLELRQDNFFCYQPNSDAFLGEENLVTSNASAFRIDSDNSRELNLN